MAGTTDSRKYSFNAEDWKVVVDGVNYGYIAPDAPAPGDPARGLNLLLGKEAIKEYPVMKSPEAEQMRADVLAASIEYDVEPEVVSSFFASALENGGAEVFCPEVMKMNPARLRMEGRVNVHDNEVSRSRCRKICDLVIGYFEKGRYFENGLSATMEEPASTTNAVLNERDRVRSAGRVALGLA